MENKCSFLESATTRATDKPWKKFECPKHDCKASVSAHPKSSNPEQDGYTTQIYGSQQCQKNR